MRLRRIALVASIMGIAPFAAHSDKLTTTITNAYGTPGGLIDMPTAEVAPDAQLSSSISHFAGTTRTTLTFQVTPRLSGSFRYTAIKGLIVPGYALPTYYDRSFDLRYQLVEEGRYRPALAIGLRDFIGTGLYGSEYIVATKSIGPKLRLTGGVGWGRLGSFNSFATTGTRPTTLLGSGGIPTYDRWFRGDVAAFGGISYAATNRLNFKVEYSSDGYPAETTDGIFNRKSPWNFGVDYQLNRSVSLSAYSLYGTEIGAKVTIALNPKDSPAPGGIETAPLPVSVRSAGSAADLGWSVEPAKKAEAQASVAQTLAREGLVLEAIRLNGTEAEIWVRNPRYDISAQAVGRAARSLTRTLPPSVETITITQVVYGQPTSAVTFRRSDLERLENAPAKDILSQATFSDGSASAGAMQQVDGAYPRLSWSLAPFIKLSVFDPDNPVRANLGIRLKGDYHLAPGWVASGAVSTKLTGNLNKITRSPRPFPVGVVPPPVVRSDFSKYEKTGAVVLDYLTVANYGRPAQDIYSRVTVGYLEPMYAGVSGEMLWKPVGSRLALGAEMNYVGKRDYDGQFGLQSYRVATGHASAYYDFGNGFHGELNVGRYLAGDYGATVALDREFANGWTVGAYATKTNLSASQFGEGSFDKGIRITMPLSWALGTPNRSKSKTVIQSLTRDGGARLNVNGRLYDIVRDTHQSEMVKSWGKFWR